MEQMGRCAELRQQLQTARKGDDFYLRTRAYNAFARLDGALVRVVNRDNAYMGTVELAIRRLGDSRVIGYLIVGPATDIPVALVNDGRDEHFEEVLSVQRY